MQMNKERHAQTSKLEIVSDSEGHSEALGRAIGLAAMGGELVGLVGELGAGKTRIAKGIAAGLAVLDEAEVRSPTFVLIREHAGRLRLFHVDAYRLAGAAELAGLGFDEILEQGGLTVVEWADHVEQALPADRLSVDLEITGPTNRRIRLNSGGAKSLEMLERIRAELGKEK